MAYKREVNDLEKRVTRSQERAEQAERELRRVETERF